MAYYRTIMIVAVETNESQHGLSPTSGRRYHVVVCGDTKGSNVGGLFSLLGGLFSGLLVCLAGCLLHTLFGGISLLGGRAG